MIQHQFYVFKDVSDKDKFFKPEVTNEQIMEAFSKAIGNPTQVDLLRVINRICMKLQPLVLSDDDINVFTTVRPLLNPQDLNIHLVNTYTYHGLTYHLQYNDPYVGNEAYYRWYPLSDKYNSQEHHEYWQYLMFVNNYTETEALY